jgi:hypothetical protein
MQMFQERFAYSLPRPAAIDHRLKISHQMC